FVLLAILWLGALAAGLLQGGFVPWFLCGSLGLLLIGSLLGPYLALRGLSGEVMLQAETATAGDSIFVQVKIQFRKIWPLSWMTVRDIWTESSGRVVSGGSRLIFSQWGRETGYRYEIPDISRGIYDKHRVEVTTGDVFGLFSLSKTVGTAGSLTVYPKPFAPGRSADIAGFGGGQDVRNPLALYAQPSADVRDYRPADPLRYVHWRATAKAGHLMVREMEAETAGWAMVFLDGSGWSEEAAFEPAVAVAAGLLQRAAESGARTGFAFAGSGRTTVMPPTLGAADLPAAFAALAGLQPGGEPGGLAALIRHDAFALPPGAAVLCVVAEPDAELVATCAALARGGRRVSVVCPAPAGTGAGGGEATAQPTQAGWNSRFAAAGCSFAAVAVPAASGIGGGAS
uniref:DUF58 domain-containing protein n=1 Tax=Gorillibacterium massiliense TaxID=1280390 RepID=UPI0005943735